MTKNSEKKGLAIGAVVGAVVGVVAGLLFAPKSGKETRQDIKNTTKKTAEAIKKEASKIEAELKETLSSLEPKLKSLKGKTLDVAKEKVTEAKNTYDNLVDVVKAFKAGKASDKDLDKAIQQARDAKESLKAFLSK
jgi:gas vesicle protein